jgi:hypothetical protein
MDYDNPQFVAAVKKVLEGSLAHLVESLQNLKDAIDAHWQADEKRYEAKPVAVTDLRTEVPIQVKTEPNRSKPEKVWHFIIGTLEAAAFLAIIIYTFLAYQQWRELIRAADASDKQATYSRKTFLEAHDDFRLDQRAWVGLKGFHCNDCKEEPPFQTDSTLKVGELGVTLANTGKTPALQMSLEGTYVSRKYSEPIPDYEASLRDRSAFWKGVGGWPPKGMSPEIKKRLTTASKFVLAPNGTHDLVIVKGLSVTRPDPKGNINDVVITYGVGKITYTDPITNKTHTTRFCIFNNGTAADFHYCTSGNEMD